MGLNRELRSFEARPLLISRTITHVDLTEAVNGTAQDIALGTFPPGTRLIGRASKLVAYFTGGAASAVNVTIGWATTPNSIMTALNVFDTSALATWLQGTNGVEPAGDIGGRALIARFTPDAGHSLLNLDAGELVIELFGAKPDRNLSIY
jgi:hypothetical protein